MSVFLYSTIFEKEFVWANKIHKVLLEDYKK